MSTVAQRLHRRWREIERIAPGLTGTEDKVLAHVDRINAEYKYFPIMTPAQARDQLNDIEKQLNSVDEALHKLLRTNTASISD
jgi:hypothetical protein